MHTGITLGVDNIDPDLREANDEHEENDMIKNLARAKDKYEAAIAMQPGAAQPWTAPTGGDAAGGGAIRPSRRRVIFRVCIGILLV